MTKLECKMSSYATDVRAVRFKMERQLVKESINGERERGWRRESADLQ